MFQHGLSSEPCGANEPPDGAYPAAGSIKPVSNSANRIVWICVVIFFGAFPHQTTASHYADGELLVKLRGGLSLSSAVSPHAQVGAQVLRVFPHLGWHHVHLPKGVSVAEGIAKYRATGGVLAVEPNYIRRVQRTPNDPLFAQQLYLAKIGATNAWNFGSGSTNVVVAVIDSGINYDHEDLHDNMWRNPGEIPNNGIDDDGNGYVDDVYGIDARNHDSDPMDDAGHGTACAGIIGAVGNNGKGIAGINWAVQLMALKYSGPDGFGFDSDLIECFEYLIQMKKRGANLRVTSNSYGGDENGQAIKDAIDAAGALGILNVFAAGNQALDNDTNPFYPSSFDSPSIISVAASDESDGIASFSNYGRASVDLAAPGLNVLTTFSGVSAYGYFSGTSAGCPHVAGAAALLAALDPSRTSAELKSALLGSVDVLPAWTNRVVSGGRLSVARALASFINSNAPAIVTSVVPSGNRTPVLGRIEVTFSKSMDRSSVQNSVTLTPRVQGDFAWSNSDRTFTLTPTVALLSATSYTGRIAGAATDATGASLDGNFNRTSEGSPADDFTWGFRTTPPNDDFANAEPISGESGTVTGSNINATKELREPNHAGNKGGASIWFRWLCPTDGRVNINTAGTGFDTVLAIYAGEDLGSLTQIAADDDDDGRTTSNLSFIGSTGKNYFIAVDGKIFADINADSPPMGAVVLNWILAPQPPLSIRSVGNNRAEIAWPSQATNFVLQVAESLEPPIQWQAASDSVMIAAGQVAIAVTGTNRARFYRLIKP